ncbi:hypothetical protein FHU30_002706 [Actinomadura rupiterrae]|nr:hypothetical protein [Actinomadura rupiterrae]
MLHTGRDGGPLIIELGDDGRQVATDWSRIRLRARGEVTGDDLLELL